MDILLNVGLANNYRRGPQIARVITEDWMARNMYCPHCGELFIKKSANNAPVKDFVCPVCHNEYELKSGKNSFKNKINDGAYNTMIERITGENNPDFFVMQYSLTDACVKNLSLIPKHFFVPDIIEKRNPLAPTSERAGWTGCNILYWKIPEQGRIAIVRDKHIEDMRKVLELTQRSQILNIDIKHRGWLMDVLNCVNSIKYDEFNLDDVYRFGDMLAIRHPENHNIKPKIRQQLQMLRDKGVLEFVRRGLYKKVRI